MSSENNTTLRYESVRAVKYPLEPISENGTIYIYGTGSSGTAFLAWLFKCRPNMNVSGFIDSNRSGSHKGLPVYSLDDFSTNVSPDSYDEILITSFAYQEIEDQLKASGLSKYRVISAPVYLLENILHDPDDDKNQYLSLLSQCENVSANKRDLQLFFGENLGKFTGNNKYLFLYLMPFFSGKIFWVAKNKEDILFMQQNNLPVIDANSDEFIDYLQRARCFYFDKMSWPRAYPWLRYFEAKKIHTSHGVGLKYTELMTIPDDFLANLNTHERDWLYANVLKNDLLLSTSPFYAKNVSEPGYGTPLEKISLAGYPKNDVFYQSINNEELNTDQVIIKSVQNKKKQGYRIVCYAPTCRHMDKNHQDRHVLNLQQLNDFCQNNQLVFILKGHGLTEQSKDQLTGLSNIYEYNNGADVYPLLRDTDLLITDYSSIYMDFLHVRKPVLFYPYDFDDYMERHCPLQFDYHKMTPGPKAYNWTEFMQWLDYFLVEQYDEFAPQRERVFELAYTFQSDGARERVLNDMLNRELIKLTEVEIS